MTTQIKDQCAYLDGQYPVPVIISFPVDGVRIEELSSDELSCADPDDSIFSTACWRNYVATWEIVDDRLYLQKLEGKYRIIGDKPVFADWFTDEFTLPQGELLDCKVELDFLLIYEREVTLRFESGVIVEKTLQNTDY